MKVTDLTTGTVVYNTTNTLAAQTAGTITRAPILGVSNSDTVHYRVDDWMVSTTLGDYP